jgi:predicted component of type VI protein secretion system
VKRWFRVMVAIALIMVLTACSSASSVPDKVLKTAIAITVNQTQQQISQQLRLSSPPKVSVDRVKVSQQDLLRIEGLPAYHVKGTYDFTLKLAKRQESQQNNSFDVYLQREPESKTWKLAQQQEGEEGLEWVMQLIE